MAPTLNRLPIDDVLPDLLRALGDGPRAVLHAPPGAGKTTRVPLAVLHDDPTWLAGSRIIMLEPRRLAARAAATWMARVLGEDVGETVGYRIRLDSRVGPRTRIEIVTEGVLTRMLQDDPSLENVGLVIFDEFHERSIHADTALAFALQAQTLLRPDLRLLVMSATLDIAGVAAVLDPVEVIRSEGRVYDVETVYLSRRIDGHIESAVAATAARAHDAHDGDILVFLPGGAEIRRTAEQLNAAQLPPSTRVIPLYGDLPQAEQDRAIAPSAPGSRKIVLATSIAETSLTIEGVRVVVDSGLMRIPRFSPRTGMTRLVTVPVSRAAADQRRGRAGRVGPGICYRMWTEGDHAALLGHRPPEILETDLAPLALQLAAWGAADPSELHWIDAPPAAAYGQARELLLELDAIDVDGRLTAHGIELARMPTHPRIAHMMIRARDLQYSATAADIAALLAERDVLRAHAGEADPDVRLRLPLVQGDAAAPIGHTIDRSALRRVRVEAQQWRKRLGVSAGARSDDECAALLLAFAYPDRIGLRRGARGQVLLRSGSGAAIDAGHTLAAADMIVAAELGGQGRTPRVFLGVQLERSDVERHFAAQIVEQARLEYDVATDAVQATRQRRLGALLLDEKPVRDIDEAEITRTLLAALHQHGLGLLHWDEDAVALRSRLAFLHHVDSAWPDVADDALLANAGQWLAQWLDARRTTRVLAGVDVGQALLGLAGWDRRQEIDRLAPTHIDVPSGSRIRIDYSSPAAPVLAVRLQEMFGAADTPRIADGAVPLTLHLLSPARRPVQVTRDLASFWRSAYFEVRKDLRGRYPKHYWPEDPLVAEPTRRTRPRG